MLTDPGNYYYVINTLLTLAHWICSLFNQLQPKEKPSEMDLVTSLPGKNIQGINRAFLPPCFAWCSWAGQAADQRLPDHWIAKSWLGSIPKAAQANHENPEYFTWWIDISNPELYFRLCVYTINSHGTKLISVNVCQHYWMAQFINLYSQSLILLIHLIFSIYAYGNNNWKLLNDCYSCVLRVWLMLWLFPSSSAHALFLSHG